MKNFKIIFLVPLVLFASLSLFYWLLFTDSSDVVYRGTYKNEPVVVKAFTKEGFIKNSTYYSVKVGDLKPISIDWNSTDTKGIPYDNSVFGATKPVFIDTSYTYENELTYDSFNEITMLYISKTDFTLKEYLIYEDFFKNNWLTVQNELLKPKNGFFTHIVGVVYGDRKDFIKVFRGSYQNNFYNLTVTPDGEIILSKDSNVMELQNSGFSNKVQMPGKIIIQKVDEMKYSLNYDAFKDKKGKILKDYFCIETEKIQVEK
ncbi:hypothetical protein [Flavobacterium sp.]|uniref:hypothetical protein n=1 Tax=Flavobacterium sp. TaxID=239 RepID=UPI00286DAD98|nr:hypothetical protein [Flavobacterium sp.]